MPHWGWNWFFKSVGQEKIGIEDRQTDRQLVTVEGDHFSGVEHVRSKGTGGEHCQNPRMPLQ